MTGEITIDAIWRELFSHQCLEQDFISLAVKHWYPMGMRVHGHHTNQSHPEDL